MPDERVARLADELIPASDGLPSASEADPAGKWLDRTLAARPDLVPAYERALAAPSAKELETSDPEAFDALTRILAGAGRGRLLHRGPAARAFSCARARSAGGADAEGPRPKA